MRPELRTVPDLDEKEDPGLEKFSYCDRQWVGLRSSGAAGAINKGRESLETGLSHSPRLWTPPVSREA